jgi:hypothetical protein
VLKPAERDPTGTATGDTAIAEFRATGPVDACGASHGPSAPAQGARFNRLHSYQVRVPPDIDCRRDGKESAAWRGSSVFRSRAIVLDGRLQAASKDIELRREDAIQASNAYRLHRVRATQSASRAQNRGAAARLACTEAAATPD